MLTLEEIFNLDDHIIDEINSCYELVGGDHLNKRLIATKKFAEDQLLCEKDIALTELPNFNDIYLAPYDNLLSSANQLGHNFNSDTSRIELIRSIFRGYDDYIMVFDFDATLTARHLYWFLQGEPQFNRLYNNVHYDSSIAHKLRDNQNLTVDENNYIVDTIWGGRARLEMIRQMLTLLHKNNITLMISSNGNVSQIKQTLKMVDMLHFFHTISGSGGHIYPTNRGLYVGKVQFLEGFVLKPNTKVAYIDDDSREHDQLRKYLPRLGYQGSSNLQFDQYTQLTDGIVTAEYLFIKSLVKDVGGGISQQEIDLIESFFKL